MIEDNPLSFFLPSVRRKKVTAAFDGSVMLLAIIEKSIGIAAKIAGLIPDPHNPRLVVHSVADIRRARMLAIAWGYM